MKKTDNLRQLAKRNFVFTINDAKKTVGEGYANLVLNKMLRRGEIKRITKGFYSIYDDPSLIVHCLRPAYIGLQDAMSYHGLWEQETSTIVITTRKVRSGLRKVFGNNVIVRRISSNYFFGFDFMEIDEIVLPVSDVEKTFIDLVYFTEMKKEYLKLFEGRLNRGTTLDYVRKYGQRFRVRVLKFLNMT